MLKKVIEYVDFDGNQRKEDHYFHMSEAELTEWRFSEQGGMEKVIERITAESDIKKIIELLKDLICRSYGRKSLDGRRFDKTDEILKDFTSTEAYSTLFMELANDTQKAAEFVNGIVPAALISNLATQQHAAIEVINGGRQD